MSLSSSKLQSQRTPVFSLPAVNAHDVEIVRADYFRWGPCVSRVAAAVLLVFALPAILVSLIIIRLTSRGPGIFRQTRVGLHGKHFRMYKLRTMRVDAEAETGPTWTQVNDPRITRVGHVLRRLHVDEFPQLFNVLMGDMALVGPRPERPEFTHHLAQLLPGYTKRLAVLPGITGLAQLNLPPDTDVDSVRRKLLLDLEYVQHGGLSMDFRLVLCTGLRIFKLPVIRLCGLHRDVRLTDGHDQPARSRLPAPVAVAAGTVLPVLLGGQHRSNGHSHPPIKPK